MTKKNNRNITAISDDYTADITTAGLVSVGNFTTGNIENNSDSDWFKVTLQAGTTYTINLEGADTGKGTLDDPYFLGIYDSVGLALGYANDDTANSLNSQAFFTPATTGDYYLAAGAFSSTVGSYQLAVVVNAAPTLSSFAAPVATGVEDTEIPITFAALQAQSNASDSDGEITAFVVNGINYGTLKIGLSPATATAWNAVSNNTIDDTHLAYWTPPLNADGWFDTFSVSAKDNAGLESTQPFFWRAVVPVEITAVPDVTLTAGTNPVEGGRRGMFTINLDSPAPAGGLKVNYAMDGTATLGTDYKVSKGAHITALTAGSFTIAAGQPSATLYVKAVSDAVADSNETIKPRLIAGTGYQFIENTVSFAPKVDYAVGNGVCSVSVGDFNGDGKPDLAVVNSDDNTVSVLLRNASNTGFDAKVDYPTGLGPVSVDVGDFNNDGKVDLAVANRSGPDGTVSLLLRNAANTGFDPKIDITTGLDTAWVSVGDFNGDGQADLAVAAAGVAGHGSGVISVLLRNAANTDFEPKVDYAVSGLPNLICVGDFNGDGKLDLATTSWGNGLVSVLFRNTTNTGFEPAIDYVETGGAISVSAGDVNNDGKLDLIVAGGGDDTVSFTLLLRNATNTGFDAYVDHASSTRPTLISAADFNSDGRTDLASINSWGSDAVSMLLRNTTNTGFNAKVDITTGISPYSLDVADFNNDGKFDLVIGGFGTVSVLINDPLHLTIANNTAPPTGTNKTISINEDNVYSFASSDFGYADSEGSPLARVTINSLPAKGALQLSGVAVSAGQVINAAALSYLSYTPAANTYGLGYASFNFTVNDGGLDSLTSNAITVNVTRMNDSLTDFNGDGKSDLLWTKNDGSLSFFIMNGIIPTVQNYSQYNASGNLGQVINSKGDYNGDGNTDLLWWNAATSSATITEMNGSTISAQAPVDYAQNKTGWTIAESSADFNADGKSDILWWNSSTHSMSLYLQNGFSSLSDATITPSIDMTNWTIKSAGGDYNGDGRGDILLTKTDGSIYMLTLNGTNITSQGTVYQGGANSWGPSTWSVVDGKGDYNYDGNADILLQDSANGLLWQFQMNGTSITNGGGYGANSGGVPAGFVVVDSSSDLNGDHKADIVMQNTSNGSALIWLMDGTTLLGGDLLGPYGSWVVQNAHNDVNGDGKADLLWTRSDGAALIFQMDGTAVTNSIDFGPYDGWSPTLAATVPAVGDFAVGLTGIAESVLG